jgi:hypothetical protein
MFDDSWFEQVAAAGGADTGDRAPATLKSKVYSALLARMAEDGRLLDLTETKRAGGQLCVFEHVLTLLPADSGIPAMNPCRVCHARVLGERVGHAPIFWPGCPYSDFHRGS